MNGRKIIRHFSNIYGDYVEFQRMINETKLIYQVTIFYGITAHSKTVFSTEIDSFFSSDLIVRTMRTAGFEAFKKACEIMKIDVEEEDQ